MNTPAEMTRFADALHHPVVIVDRVGAALHANAAFLDLAGRDLAALRALTWPVLRAPILGRRAADRTWSVGRATLLRAERDPLPVRVDAIPGDAMAPSGDAIAPAGDGPPDARARRPRSHPQTARPLRPPPPYRRAHRQRHPRRPRPLLRGRHG